MSSKNSIRGIEPKPKADAFACILKKYKQMYLQGVAYKRLLN